MISRTKCKKTKGVKVFNTCIYSIRKVKKKQKPEPVTRKRKPKPKKVEPFTDAKGSLTKRGRQWIFRGGLTAFIVLFFVYMAVKVPAINRTPVPDYAYLLFLLVVSGAAFYWFIWRD